MSQQPGTFDFGSVAASYDEWYKTRLGRTYDALEKRSVERMLPALSDGNRLLEVGCGTGHWSAFFSGRGFKVTAVDISPEMIAVTKGKHIANVCCEVADAHALPFENGCFDIATAITTLEFVRDAETVVREMARCTRRPGGTVLVAVLNALADVNIRRKAKQRPPYNDARFLSPAQLAAMLAPYGTVRVSSTTFVPRSGWALPFAPLTDFVGRVLQSQRGALVLGEVIL